MKNHFTICVDMDDTIENLLSAWVKWLDEKYDLSVKESDITDWDIKLFFPTLSEDEVFEPLFIEDFWKIVQPKEDAVEYLKRLQNEGHKVYIVTSSHPESLAFKYEHVLRKHFYFIDRHNFIITHDKFMVNCDIFVDDGPHNLVDLPSRTLPLLFTAQHNKSYPAEKNRMIRVDSWEEAYKMICAYDVICQKEQ